MNTGPIPEKELDDMARLLLQAERYFFPNDSMTSTSADLYQVVLSMGHANQRLLSRLRYLEMLHIRASNLNKED